MSCAEACWRKIGVRFHATVVTKNVLSKFIPEPYRPAHTKSVILEQKSMARSRTGQILPEGSRVYVEEQLFRADVEERLFRAASAFAFDCGLQPRPALKGIHHPAVAAMNAALPRSRKLFCSGRVETSHRKKHRGGSDSWYPTLVSAYERAAMRVRPAL